MQEEDRRHAGEHERRNELEASRGFCRTEQARTEEIGGKYDRKVDERHERAEQRALPSDMAVASVHIKSGPGLMMRAMDPIM